MCCYILGQNSQVMDLELLNMEALEDLEKVVSENLQELSFQMRALPGFGTSWKHLQQIQLQVLQVDALETWFVRYP